MDESLYRGWRIAARVSSNVTAYNFMMHNDKRLRRNYNTRSSRLRKQSETFQRGQILGDRIHQNTKGGITDYVQLYYTFTRKIVSFDGISK